MRPSILPFLQVFPTSQAVSAKYAELSKAYGPYLKVQTLSQGNTYVGVFYLLPPPLKFLRSELAALKLPPALLSEWQDPTALPRYASISLYMVFLFSSVMLSLLFGSLRYSIPYLQESLLVSTGLLILSTLLLLVGITIRNHRTI
jgi:hypothetical protein